jgi:hypothetical protein
LPRRIEIQANHRDTESQSHGEEITERRSRRGDHREEITERRSQRGDHREEGSEKGGFEHV